MKDNVILLEKLKSGDEKALDEIVNENMGLVKSIALRFVHRSIEYEDLCQIGAIGLMRAARSFDFSYGTVFSTYAVPLIIGEIKRYLRDDGIIKVSRSIKSSGIAIMKKREEFANLYGREPSVSELAELSSMSKEEIASIIEACSPVSSLSDKSDKDDCALEDFIADERADFDSFTEKMALSDAIKKLPPEQQKIIHLRYERDLSQEKTGEILGVTQVKVSREEKKILEKLRTMLG